MATMHFQILRRNTGSPGVPANLLLKGELAFNEVDYTLYYGYGIGTGNLAASVLAIGGKGAFVDLSSNQTVAGTKTFTGIVDGSGATNVKVPTLGSVVSTTDAASTAYVNSFYQPKSTLLTSLAANSTVGLLAQTATGVAGSVTITGTASNIVVTNGTGASGNPTINLATVTFTAGAAGTAYTKLIFDSFGRVTSGQTLATGDLPAGVALLGSSATFTAGLFNSSSIGQYSNNTTVATTAWVNAAGLGVAPTIYTFTANQTLSATHGGALVLFNGTALTCTLPLISTSGILAGTIITISNITSITGLTLTTTSTDTLDEGANSINMPAGERIVLACDGSSAWRTVSRSNFKNPVISGSMSIASSLTVTGSATVGNVSSSGSITITGSANLTLNTGNITGATNITGTGTLTAASLSLTGTQTANKVFAAPSGSTGAPIFRTLVAADLPTATTQSQYNNSTAIATTAWVNTRGVSASPTVTTTTGGGGNTLNVTDAMGGSIIVHSPASSGNTVVSLPTSTTTTMLTGTYITFLNNAPAGVSNYMLLQTGGSDVFDDPTATAAGSNLQINPSEHITLALNVATATWYTISRYTPSNPSYSGNLTVSGNATISGTLSAGATTVTSLSITGTQTANKFLGSPSGSTGAPTFRTLVSADLPTTLVSNPAAYTNNTSIATTAWVNVRGLGVNPTIFSLSSSTTLSATHGGGLVLLTANALTITLPLISTSGILAGTIITISHVATGNGGTIATTSTDTLDEGAPLSLSSNERIVLVCDGVSAWRTLSRSSFKNPNISGTITVGGNLSLGTGNFGTGGPITSGNSSSSAINLTNATGGITLAGGGITGVGNVSAVSLTLSGTVGQNFVFAGPSASSGAPSFRVLAASDLPLATVSTAGAVIVGTGLSVASGTISANVVSVAGLTGAITAVNLATQLTTLAPLAGPSFTGSVTAPTAANGTNSTIVATTAYVLAVRHDQLAAPTASVSWNNQNLTSLADPVNPQDAANKRYVDNNIQGLQTKPTAWVATAAALPANTYNNGSSGVGATLTATSNAILTIDGQTMNTLNQIVLVKNEATQANNGLYTVTQVGSASVPYILTRQIDMNLASEVSGAFIPVEFGTANANSLWLCNPSGAVTIGTTALTFVQLNGATSLSAGNGINIAGNSISAVGTANRITVGAAIDIASTYVGQASITTLGTISTGVWAGTIIGAAYGGFGTNVSAATGYPLFASGTPSFSTTIPNTSITGLGTMSTQAASAVAITGGTIDNITLDAGTF